MADTIRTGMPVLARHEGEWKGEYVLHAPDGSVLDRHDSHLICTFPDASDGLRGKSMSAASCFRGRAKTCPAAISTR